MNNRLSIISLTDAILQNLIIFIVNINIDISDFVTDYESALHSAILLQFDPMHISYNNRDPHA